MAGPRAGSVLGCWSGRRDLNPRPPVPQTGALPDCATPRLVAQSSTGQRRSLPAAPRGKRPHATSRRVSSPVRAIPATQGGGPLVRTAHSARAALGAVGVIFALAGNALASTPGTDVRLTNDNPGGTGYVSDYTLVTGTAYTDATLTECSRSRGRENEPAIAVDPRNTNVLVGSSNDYCGVYNNGSDADGAPIPSGPIWLGYYRSENSGHSFVSSLVPGYPGDTSTLGALAQIRTASAGDPVVAWDAQGRVFMGSESR